VPTKEIVPDPVLGVRVLVLKFHWVITCACDGDTDSEVATTPKTDTAARNCETRIRLENPSILNSGTQCRPVYLPAVP